MNPNQYRPLGGIKKQMYEGINALIDKNSFGSFHKCLFHLHTPASYDYLLFDSKKGNDDDYFKNLSEDDIRDIAISEGLFPEPFDKHSFDYPIIYSTFKEFIAYLLIADQICKNDIELIVIADHNTIEGYEKLNNAVDIYCKSKYVKKRPTIILGVEISCADKLHIVGVFHDSIKQLLSDWLKNEIMSFYDGTYLTSAEVLKSINSLKGIGYIAHINTSDIFSKNYLNDSFRKNLLNSEYLKAIGLSDKTKEVFIQDKISNYRTSEICYILDSDSHGIDTISMKCFWIKGQRCNYAMIEKALQDYTISLQLEKPTKPSKYIKGISIKPFEEGFLTGKKDGLFNLVFSEDLNCLIGGRGTGKSTLINILIFILSQNCINKDLLKFICLHEYILVLYHYEKRDFIIFFNTPGTEYNGNDDAVERFSDYYGSYMKEEFDRKRIADFVFKNCMEIYEIKGDILTQLSSKDAKNLLFEFFNLGYSINELVSISNRGEISDFINSIVLRKNKIAEEIRPNYVYSATGLLRILKELEDRLKERQVKINELIESYNETQNKKLKILYTINNYGYFKASFLFNQYNFKEYFHGYNIKFATVISYLEHIESQIGLIELLKNILNRNFDFFIDKYPINQFLEEMSKGLIDLGVRELNKNNFLNFYDLLNKDISNIESIKHLNYQIRKYLGKCEKFDLQFNIYNRETITNSREIYRSIQNLSLGQKVVALLSFILSFGDYIKDITPLIIDQPEDNLDNRYIYKNLVSDLRRVKVKRQVIIATHSSTIVTNAKAEQVIVMESDGRKGWVENTGYPTQKNIIKHIINYLEGGVDSFNHKASIYKDVIKLT